MQELIELIGRYGVLFVFANVLIEQVGLPVPALPTLVLAGALAADGKVSAPLALLAALLASTLADGAWYLVGRRYGHRVLRTICRLSLSPDSCVRRTENVFDRYGLFSLVLAKFIPVEARVLQSNSQVVGDRCGKLPVGLDEGMRLSEVEHQESQSQSLIKDGQRHQAAHAHLGHKTHRETQFFIGQQIFYTYAF